MHAGIATCMKTSMDASARTGTADHHPQNVRGGGGGGGGGGTGSPVVWGQCGQWTGPGGGSIATDGPLPATAAATGGGAGGATRPPHSHNSSGHSDNDHDSDAHGDDATTTTTTQPSRGHHHSAQCQQQPADWGVAGLGDECDPPHRQCGCSQGEAPPASPLHLGGAAPGRWRGRTPNQDEGSAR